MQTRSKISNCELIHYVIYCYFFESRALDIGAFQDSISIAQRYASYLALSFFRLIDKTSKVRDVGDEISGALLEFTQTDNFDQLYHMNLVHFSNCLSSVEDHCDSKVN